jgi:hypothetical protein
MLPFLLILQFLLILLLEELLRELGALQGDTAVGAGKEPTPFDRVKDYIKKNLR